MSNCHPNFMALVETSRDSLIASVLSNLGNACHRFSDRNGPNALTDKSHQYLNDNGWALFQFIEKSIVVELSIIFVERYKFDRRAHVLLDHLTAPSWRFMADLITESLAPLSASKLELTAIDLAFESPDTACHIPSPNLAELRLDAVDKYLIERILNSIDFPFLTSLYIRLAGQSQPAISLGQMNILPRLTRLSLGGSFITDDLVITLLNAAPSLAHLALFVSINVTNVLGQRLAIRDEQYSFLFDSMCELHVYMCNWTFDVFQTLTNERRTTRKKRRISYAYGDGSDIRPIGMPSWIGWLNDEDATPSY